MIAADGNTFSVNRYPWFSVYDTISGVELGRLRTKTTIGDRQSSTYQGHQYLEDGRIAIRESIGRGAGMAARIRILAPESAQVLETLHSPIAKTNSVTASIAADGSRVVFMYTPLDGDSTQIDVRDGNTNKLLRRLIDRPYWQDVIGGVVATDGSTFVMGGRPIGGNYLLAAYQLP
jgi:hypothetical protein